MKNSQQGFIGIAVIILVALVAIGSGVYIYTQKEKLKVVDKETINTYQATSTTDITTTLSATSTPTATTSPTSETGKKVTNQSTTNSAEKKMLSFNLQAPEGEVVMGDVSWTITLYGPNGIIAGGYEGVNDDYASLNKNLIKAGVTATTSGKYGQHIDIAVEKSVVGEIVLSTTFPSVSGKTILGLPTVILERSPGNAIVGIELYAGTRKDEIRFEHDTGPIPLDVWALYDNGVKSKFFMNQDNMIFKTANPDIVTINFTRYYGPEIELHKPGQSNIVATYKDKWTDNLPVIVQNDGIRVTSATNVTAAVGQPFEYIIKTNREDINTIKVEGLGGLSFDEEKRKIFGTLQNSGYYTFRIAITSIDGTESWVTVWVEPKE